ncbi:MAG UNVERIFIED_CONTAM: cadherin repeat domain-containing protein [Planctomycetaceae bacterium]
MKCSRSKPSPTKAGKFCGFAGTKPTAHAANSPIELFPVSWDRREKNASDYQAFLGRSPFVVPSPPKNWAPRIAGVSDKTIRPGEEVKFTVRAENANPELGDAVFALKDAADGMSLDPKSGEFLWKPAAELAPGKYTAKVVMHQSGQPETTFDDSLTITLREPNTPPKLEIPKSAIVVLGREFSLQVNGADDGPANTLKYSLGGGARKDSPSMPSSGLIRWKPARSFTPGRYDLTVKATDSGDSPQSASATIALDVQDDYASMTLLTGTVSRDDIWYAWLRNKGTGITARLKIGEFIRISDIDAEIADITNRFVTFRDTAGLWKLELGQLLRDRQLIEPCATARRRNPSGTSTRSKHRCVNTGTHNTCGPQHRRPATPAACNTVRLQHRHLQHRHPQRQHPQHQSPQYRHPQLRIPHRQRLLPLLHQHRLSRRQTSIPQQSSTARSPCWALIPIFARISALCDLVCPAAILRRECQMTSSAVAPAANRQEGDAATAQDFRK